MHACGAWGPSEGRNRAFTGSRIITGMLCFLWL